MWIDPPSGWNYGFPKLIEKEDVLDNIENKLLKDFYGEI
jgi:hypothetical protein